MKQLLIIILISLSSYQIVTAAHMMGGEITWECNGAGYVFTLKIYRDCNGTVFTTAPQIINVSGHPAISSISVSFADSTDFSPQGCGYSCFNNTQQGAFQEYIYMSDPINLGNSTPPPQGWSFSWTLCCRNGTIQNLPGPGGLSFTLRSTMYSFSGLPATPCFDNSPAFAERPKTHFCNNLASRIPVTAFDKDFDELRYRWAEPQDMLGINISYSGAYTINLQYPGFPVLDSLSGMITRSASTVQGNFISCYKVESYKCNVKVAEVYRDIQLGFMSTCGNIAGSLNNNNPAIFYGSGNQPSVIYDTVFAGERINFPLTIQDGDISTNLLPQSVRVDVVGLLLGNNGTDSTTGCTEPPCAYLNNYVPQNFTVGYNYLFTWQTSCAHVGDSCKSSDYSFLFSATDNHCPVNGSSHFIYHVTVKGPEIFQRGDTLFTDFPNASFQWFLNGIPIAGAMNSYYIITDPGNYTVEVIDDMGCSLLSPVFNPVINSIKDHDAFEFSLHPNPSKGNFSVSFQSNTSKEYLIEVFDVNGRTVFAEKRISSAGKNEFLIDAECQPGLYYMQLSDGFNKKIRKLILL